MTTTVTDADTMATSATPFPLHWTRMFLSASATSAAAHPRLGVDFVQASASEVSIPLIPTVGHASAADRAEVVVIRQDLSKFGIAGVVWDCVRGC